MNKQKESTIRNGKTFTSLTSSDSRYYKENDNSDQSSFSDVDLLTEAKAREQTNKTQLSHQHFHSAH